MGIGMYNTFKFWLLRGARNLCDIQFYGKENLVEKGPLIVASNHTSYLDPILLGISYRRPLGFMARHTLFTNPYFGWLIRNVYAFPVERDGEGGSIKALKAFCKRLGQERGVVIFPEGTRSENGRLKPFESSVGMLAVRGKSPVQPIYIMGAWHVWPKGGKCRPAPLRIYIAPAIYPKENLKRNEKRQEQERIGAELYKVLSQLEERAWAEYPEKYKKIGNDPQECPKETVNE